MASSANGKPRPAKSRSAIIKRSVEIGGRKTSVSLEDIFWEELRAVAEAHGMSITSLIAEIDDARGDNGNLSSAIRIYLLERLLDLREGR